jgi:hypothetical protein
MVYVKVQSRRGLALTLTLALAVVACSSLWHHDHGQSLPHKACSNERIGTQLQEAHRSDNCPVCLSQRLLTQSWGHEAGYSFELVLLARDIVQAELLPVTPVSDLPEARAPPCC